MMINWHKNNLIIDDGKSSNTLIGNTKTSILIIRKIFNRYTSHLIHITTGIYVIYHPKTITCRSRWNLVVGLLRRNRNPVYLYQIVFVILLYMGDNTDIKLFVCKCQKIIFTE